MGVTWTRKLLPCSGNALYDSSHVQFPQEKLLDEQMTIRAEIGKIHAEIWRLVRGRNSAFVDQIAQCKLDIQSKTRRVKTIDYLLAYMNGKTIALSC